MTGGEASTRSRQIHVFATTHLFTLGTLGAATLGALHQFIPVVTGVGLRHPRAAIWSVWVHPMGVAALAASMWWWSPVGQLVGWILLFLAVGLGSWNILPARRRARANAYVGAFVSLPHSALGLGMVIALVRIGDGMGWWTTWRDGQLLAHFHLGCIGYGTLTVAGIGSKMLPAFLGLAEHADVQRVPPAYRRIGWLLSLGLVALAFGAPFRIAWLTWVGAALLAAGVGMHLAVLIGYFARRTGPMDPAIAAIAAAVASYAIALGLGLITALVWPRATRMWAAYGVAAIAGWLTLMIVGVMHRIGPWILGADGERTCHSSPRTSWVASATRPWSNCARSCQWDAGACSQSWSGPIRPAAWRTGWPWRRSATPRPTVGCSRAARWSNTPPARPASRWRWSAPPGAMASRSSSQTPSATRSAAPCRPSVPASRTCRATTSRSARH